MFEIKKPAEKQVYPYDFTAKAGGVALDEILSVTQQVRGSGDELVNGGAAIVGAQVRVAWSGGTDGEIYRTAVLVRDAAGQEHQIDGEIAVLETDWTMPDGGAPWLSIAEFVDMFGIEEVVAMTDVDGVGRIKQSLLVKALTSAQSLGELNLAVRYALPLAEVPEAVKTAIADIARARLYPRGAPEGIDTAGKAAVRVLERISKGELPLPVATPPAPAESAAPILSAPGCRQYPHGLKDY